MTLHRALFTKSVELKQLLVDVHWAVVLKQISCGLEQCHSRYGILHNDLKCDNIVLTSTIASQEQSSNPIRPVIIDFGKACEISKGKVYNLSPSEKEHYIAHHPHIAPDQRDGLCSQSTSSDILLWA